MASGRNSVDAASSPPRNLLSYACCLLLASLGLSGCHIERIVLEEPVKSQFVEVCSEDHIVVRLDEDSLAGFRWSAACSDPLVNIEIEHEPGEMLDGQRTEPGLATVHLRVRRGFSGLATVRLRCVRTWSGECARSIDLALRLQDTNVALWM